MWGNNLYIPANFDLQARTLVQPRVDKTSDIETALVFYSLVPLFFNCLKPRPNFTSSIRNGHGRTRGRVCW